MSMLRLFLIKAGEWLNQRTIATLLQVSPPAVAKALPLLEREEMILVKRDKKMNLNLVSLNRNLQSVLQYKRSENLKLLYELGLVLFLEDSFPGSTIILFGSYARGEDTTKSDMDIAVVGAKQKKIDLSKYEKIFEREIRLQFYTSLKEIHKELRENICNGIVLVGSIEL